MRANQGCANQGAQAKECAQSGRLGEERAFAALANKKKKRKERKERGSALTSRRWGNPKDQAVPAEGLRVEGVDGMTLVERDAVSEVFELGAVLLEKTGKEEVDGEGTDVEGQMILIVLVARQPSRGASQPEVEPVRGRSRRP